MSAPLPAPNRASAPPPPTLVGMLATPEDRLPRRLIILTGLLAAGLISIVTSSRTYVSMIDHGHDWWRIFVWHFAGWTFWAAAAALVLSLGARLIHPPARPRLWLLRLLGVAVALTAVHVPLTAAVYFVLQPYEPIGTYSFAAAVQREAALWWKADPLIFGMLVAVGYGFAGYRASRRAELQRSRLQAELSKAQLEALQLQIQPHFLMNTLNTIAALVRRADNVHALDMLIDLSELLRTTLDSSRGPLVPLRDEIAFLERYAELQRARFADRLTIAFAIDADCQEVPVPIMLLQPLVENAIRHGVGKRAGAGNVTIQASRENGFLRLSVEDDGQGFATGFDLDDQAGIGLRNIRSRLDQVYGTAARFEVANRSPAGAIVTLDLPVTAPASEGPA